MKNYLKIALGYRKKNMLPSEVTEEVLLDDMSMEEAMKLWMALIAVYGCRDFRRCVKFYKGRQVSLDFSELFDYATDESGCDYYELLDRFNNLINSEEFEEILRDPVMIVS